MRYLPIIILLLITRIAYAQSLRDINFNYLYNPAESFRFDMKPVRTSSGWEVFFRLRSNEPAADLKDFSITWELRKALTEKEGTPLDSLENTAGEPGEKKLAGRFFLPDPLPQEILLAKVTNNSSKRQWMFYAFLRRDWPVNMFLKDTKGEFEFSSFIDKEARYQIEGVSAPVVVSCFSDSFPAAAPAFSEGLTPVPSVMRYDSSFTLAAGVPVTFTIPGLYLIQSDTASQQGLAFRVAEDYPKYQRLENLAEPLVYVTTKQEYERLRLANGEKKLFDRVILSVTRDAGRAQDFMRSYFRRVEIANRLFTSYKDGWKTDRGMIYIIFGLPEEVYRFNDRETWQYNNSRFKLTFNFVRTGTLFDPENYVLIRDKKFQAIWYEMIDLWRNARF